MFRTISLSSRVGPQADDGSLSGLEIHALAAVAGRVDAGDIGAHALIDYDPPLDLHVFSLQYLSICYQLHIGPGPDA